MASVKNKEKLRLLHQAEMQIVHENKKRLNLLKVIDIDCRDDLIDQRKANKAKTKELVALTKKVMKREKKKEINDELLRFLE